MYKNKQYKNKICISAEEHTLKLTRSMSNNYKTKEFMKR